MRVKRKDNPNFMKVQQKNKNGKMTTTYKLKPKDVAGDKVAYANPTDFEKPIVNTKSAVNVDNVATMADTMYDLTDKELRMKRVMKRVNAIKSRNK